MKKEIKDFLPKYMGCNLSNGGKVTPELLTSINESTFNAWKDIKPVLRPYSDISKLSRQEQEGWNRISTTVNSQTSEGIAEAAQAHWNKRMDYYRSLGIDCDGLIEAGLAVKKGLE